MVKLCLVDSCSSVLCWVCGMVWLVGYWWLGEVKMIDIFVGIVCGGSLFVLMGMVSMCVLCVVRILCVLG